MKRPPRRARHGRLGCAGAALGAVLVLCLGTAPAAELRPADGAMSGLIPKPVRVTSAGGVFTVQPTAHIVARPASAEVLAVATSLAQLLNRAPGYRVTIVRSGAPAEGDILLSLVHDGAGLGAEGYRLSVGGAAAALVAQRADGLFWGVQTIRQLLPARVERASPGPGTWSLPTGVVVDHPRFVWRGAMLDVSRHFFGVAAVERFVDLMAAYKLNRLHLHLSDDQGWRIAIRSWPRLATHGGSTAVGGGRGGYYTQRQYAQIAAYAERRHVVAVPELEFPGHATAALSSYPQLSCDGVAPPLATGAAPERNSLCAGRPATYSFADDVVREVAALTPGPYFHVGGDEAATTPAAYVRFMAHVEGERQAARRLGGDRKRPPPSGRDRATLGDCLARQACGGAGRAGHHVARDEGVHGHEVRPFDTARNDLGRLHERP